MTHLRLGNSTATACDDCKSIARIAGHGGSDSASSLPPSSSKIRKAVELLTDIERRSGGQQKTIVFSQFTSFLNIVEPFLKQAQIKFVRCEFF